MDSQTLTRSSTSSTASSSPMSPDRAMTTSSFSSSTRPENKFLGAIREKIRDHSRSRSRSRSPLPPTSMPSSQSPSPSRPQGSRNVSNGSQTTSLKDKRSSTASSNSQFSYYGRHSNEWLFNNFSVTDSIKDAYHHFKPRHD
ncbi:uncharacterized protein K452DRAFT_290097 [Aplosporella prunicola CBS 121167]|uniref:Uncharacterized protein n=1 Tax=Aplosporella prunicola CBS 121167 TaxID=1176127 RepID=A0A6A6B4P1_9PEZI|nr:uncharacterized protein K452DRAFT_290097 [Aplosporella prunicola CBS 121167]KAF2139000.1 hypothetical protein K452DRAFT_290097 [Aplosporella prunicola CBS 121167]